MCNGMADISILQGKFNASRYINTSLKHFCSVAFKILTASDYAEYQCQVYDAMSSPFTQVPYEGH
jgi:hypothetical protein